MQCFAFLSTAFPAVIRSALLVATVLMSLSGSTLMADDAGASQVKRLRHAVFFSFKPTSSDQDIEKVVQAFKALPAKIDAIDGFQWGTAVSKAKKTGGFTHAFILTFKDEQARSEYLPHPEHKAFGEILRPHMNDVFVVDYFASDIYQDTFDDAEKQLVHPVFFRFKQSATPQDIQSVVNGFIALAPAIDTVKHFEWGVNNSPEPHDDGFTHCFLVTFADSDGLAAYVPHPAHQAYVKTLGPVDQLRVIDFVTQP